MYKNANGGDVLGGVWLELFLLDNALMGFLILKAAEPFAAKRLNTRMTAAVCTVSGIVSALAMTEPFFLSAPVKLLLLAFMTAAFIPKDAKTAVRCAFCVLLATFVMGGLAYALAGFLDGAFAGGVLYADVSTRAILIATAVSLALPRRIKKLVARRRLSPEIMLTIENESGRVTLNAKLDTGNSLTEPVTGLPAIVASKEKTAPLFESQRKYFIGYTSVGGDGALTAVKAEAYYGDSEKRKCVVAASSTPLIGTDAIVNAELFMT